MELGEFGFDPVIWLEIMLFLAGFGGFSFRESVGISWPRLLRLELAGHFFRCIGPLPERVLENLTLSLPLTHLTNRLEGQSLKFMMEGSVLTGRRRIPVQFHIRSASFTITLEI